jgi:hypothetical protein
MEKSQIFALKIPDDLLILSCEEDHAICVPLLDKGWHLQFHFLLHKSLSQFCDKNFDLTWLQEQQFTAQSFY